MLECKVYGPYCKYNWLFYFPEIDESSCTWKSHDLGQCFSNLGGHQIHPEGLLKHRSQGPTARVSDSVGPEWAWEFAFLTSTQVTLMLLVQGPHSENHHRILNTWKTIHPSPADQGKRRFPESRHPHHFITASECTWIWRLGREPSWSGPSESLLSHFNLVIYFLKGLWK